MEKKDEEIKLLKEILEAAIIRVNEIEQELSPLNYFKLLFSFRNQADCVQSTGIKNLEALWLDVEPHLDGNK